MAYIGQGIKSGTFSVLDTSGNTYNGSNVTFSLGTQVGSPAQLLVSHDGVIQKPGTDYTLATGGTQITFTTAPASGASIFIVEISGAVGGPINGDLDGAELVLDTDGDTSITADTDDQIDIKVGGSDRFKFDNSGHLSLLTDSAAIKFGADSDVTLTHDPDDGLFFKSAATADNNPVLLTLQTGETDMAADDVIGKISFQAPDEGTGTDAILVSAAVQAVAEGDHSSSSNATRLEFMTGSSEAATSKMSLSSAALLTVTDASPKVKILPTTNGNSGVVEICGRATDGSPVENRTQIKGEPEGSTANTRMSFHVENASGVNEVMRITSGGDVGIGTTSVGAKLVVADDVADFVARFTNDGDDANRDGIYIQGGHDNGSGTTSYLVVADGDGNSTGELQTSSGTFQLTDTSDSRLKQNIVDTSINGIDSIKSLKVRDFAYKKNPTETIVGGFIAQELKEVYPQAVSEGRTEEKILSVSRERLVPLLTKGLQEAITKIETLETEITALKSRVTTLEG